MTRGLKVIASRSESLSRFTAPTRGSRSCRRRSWRRSTCPPFCRSRRTSRRARHQGRGGRTSPSGRRRPDRAAAHQPDSQRRGRGAETGGGVRVGWHAGGGSRQRVDLWVDDEGPGLSNTANLFVPFFTTKPGGSGIGLVLCRQIAERTAAACRTRDRPGRASTTRRSAPRAVTPLSRRRWLPSRPGSERPASTEPHLIAETLLPAKTSIVGPDLFQTVGDVVGQLQCGTPTPCGFGAMLPQPCQADWSLRAILAANTSPVISPVGSGRIGARLARRDVRSARGV